MITNAECGQECDIARVCESTIFVSSIDSSSLARELPILSFTSVRLSPPHTWFWLATCVSGCEEKGTFSRESALSLEMISFNAYPGELFPEMLRRAYRICIYTRADIVPLRALHNVVLNEVTRQLGRGKSQVPIRAKICVSKWTERKCSRADEIRVGEAT